MIEVKQGLLSGHEKLVPLCDWGCGIWSCIDCETGAILSSSEFGLRDLEQDLYSWFYDWISGVNLWDRTVVVDLIKIKHPRTKQWALTQAVTGMSDCLVCQAVCHG